MRYTEARLSNIAEELLADIEQNTVDFTVNFDDSLNEPSVLPSRLPNMLVNGASGIAVGMATNIPPHNLGEICDAVCHVIDHPNCGTEDLIKLVPGPDFPTRGNIRGTSGILDAYNTGRGRIVMEATTEIEELRGGRQRILVTELPYQVNKASLVEKIAQLVRDKKIDGISDIRDESDRHGMRVVIELRRDAQANITLNNLYRHTALRSSFNAIMLSLVDGQPQVLPLKRAIDLFIQHREEVIRRRSEFRLQRAQERDHILQGLLLALDRLDEVIAIIRGSQDAETARNNLMDQLQLSQVQAQAILDMQLRRLAALERQRLEQEHADLVKTIASLEALLASPDKISAEVKTETRKVKKDFGDARRTVIHADEVEEQTAEQFITHQDVVVTLSQRGYIKRVPCDTYKSQHRGGKGVEGMKTREDDVLMDMVVVDTHDTLLFFTNRGRVYTIRVFQIAADTTRTSRGTLLVNLIALARGEQVQAMLPIRDRTDEDLMILATRLGEVKALRKSALSNISSRGLNAMDLEEGDELVSVVEVGDAKDVIMVSEMGKAIRFPVADLRVASRASGGVRGMKLSPGDRIVALDAVKPDGRLLVVSREGYAKSTPVSRYRHQTRNGGGVGTFKVTDKTGPVAAARVVPSSDGQEILIISAKAQVIRFDLDDVRVTDGRVAQGVIVWRDRKPDDYVASLTCFQTTDYVQASTSKSSGASSTNGNKAT
jgi:DNA gyrase subunit A